MYSMSFSWWKRWAQWSTQTSVLWPKKRPHISANITITSWEGGGHYGCKAPNHQKQVRSSLGLAGWYKRFILNFSEKAAALTDLTWKCWPNRLEWTEECEMAFKALKDTLSQEPLLLSLDFFLCRQMPLRGAWVWLICKGSMHSSSQWLTLVVSCCQESTTIPLLKRNSSL